MGADLGAGRNEREAELFGGATDEAFIGVAVAPAELMVEMGDDEPPAVQRREAGEQVQQGHGIRASGNGDEEGFAVAQEFLGAEGCFNPFRKIAHGGRLVARSNRRNLLY